MRSKSRGQTCLYYALQGGGKDRKAGLKEKGERPCGTSPHQHLSPFSFFISHFLNIIQQLFRLINQSQRGEG